MKGRGKVLTLKDLSNILYYVLLIMWLSVFVQLINICDLLYNLYIYSSIKIIRISNLYYHSHDNNIISIIHNFIHRYNRCSTMCPVLYHYLLKLKVTLLSRGLLIDFLLRDVPGTGNYLMAGYSISYYLRLIGSCSVLPTFLTGPFAWLCRPKEQREEDWARLLLILILNTV